MQSAVIQWLPPCLDDPLAICLVQQRQSLVPQDRVINLQTAHTFARNCLNDIKTRLLEAMSVRDHEGIHCCQPVKQSQFFTKGQPHPALRSNLLAQGQCRLPKRGGQWKHGHCQFQSGFWITLESLDAVCPECTSVKIRTHCNPEVLNSPSGILIGVNVNPVSRHAHSPRVCQQSPRKCPRISSETRCSGSHLQEHHFFAPACSDHCRQSPPPQHLRELPSRSDLGGRRSPSASTLGGRTCLPW